MKSLTRRLFIAIVCLGGCGLIGKADRPLRDADCNGIVNIGDSVFANSGDINNILYGYAEGTFRHYSRNSSKMIGIIVGSAGKPIPDQYDEAKKDNPDISLVYLDGGADDILYPFVLFRDQTCVAGSDGQISIECKDLIDSIATTAGTLLDEMYSDGVEHVVWMGYYHIKRGLYGDPKLNPAVDYANPRLKSICNSSWVDCTFVDPRNAFAGQENAYIMFDGLHPTYEGSRVLADLLWPEIMSERLDCIRPGPH